MWGSNERIIVRELIKKTSPAQAGQKGEIMKFIYYTIDGKRHEKTITDKEEILSFINWLETDNSVKKWF